MLVFSDEQSSKVDRKKERENYSLWMDMLYKLSLCNHVSLIVIKHVRCFLHCLVNYLDLYETEPVTTMYRS